MAQGRKRQVRGRREGQDRNRDIFEVCLAQRRSDTYGRRLRVFSLNELSNMNANLLDKVRADGWLSLPDLQLPHTPPCECADCEQAKANWRERCGRD